MAEGAANRDAREERCLRHREWRRTRHPRLGAAESRAALSVNAVTQLELANCRWCPSTSGAVR